MTAATVRKNCKSCTPKPSKKDNVFNSWKSNCEADEITQRYNVENLYVLRANVDDGGRLLAKRRFYVKTFAALYAETKRQAETIDGTQS